jgi:hypothetical protein
MVRAITLFIALVGFLAPAARGQERVGRIEVSAAAEYFAEVKRQSDRDGGKLWGVALNGPFFFVDPASQEIVANQADREGKLKQQGSVWVGKLPPNVLPANAAADWAGLKWTMVMWPPPELEHSRLRLLMHECFHRIQDGIGLPAGNPNNAHLDEKDGRIWMRLEMRALAEALSQSGDERKLAIEDALAFRFRRAAQCGQQSAAAERELEMNEGLAEYTGLVTSGFGKPSWETRAAVRLEQEQANSTFARSFAYATGPAYGLLLDAYRVEWRNRLSPAVSLPRLLMKAIKRSNLTGDTSARTARYGGERVIGYETLQAERRAQKIAELRKAFVEGPTLSLPVGSMFSFSFDPGGVDSFPGVGQVFASAKVSDEWGVLTVQSGGVLMKRPESKFTGVALRAPADPSGPTVKGDGWTLQLNPGWKIAPGARAGDWVITRADG